MDNLFWDLKLNAQTIDIFLVRTSIQNSITKNLNQFHGVLLDVGCGKMPYKKYIVSNSSVVDYVGLDIQDALDYDEVVKPDFTWDGIVMPFESESFDCAIATEVLEHCPEPNVVLSEAYRVLKPGATFFFTIPFLWPLHEVPNDEFRYTPFSLERYLSNAGFKNISILPMGGWNASLAQMLGLWIRRSQMSNLKRKILSFLILPIFKYLIKTDIKPEKFSESTMITGLYGVAHKM